MTAGRGAMPRAAIKAILAVAVAGLAAACAGGPPSRGQGDGTALERGATAPRPRAGAARVPVDAPKVSELAGRSAEEVARRLGPPQLTRHEPPAEVWQYAGEACVLDIVFYPEEGAGAPRADYLESRDLDGHGLDTPDCLARLAAEGRF